MREKLTLQDFMEVVKYHITEGDNYGWSCYGSNAFSMTSWNGNQDDNSANIVFDTATQVVYEMSACDYNRNRAYRWINPKYRDAHAKEAATYSSDPNEAWDDVKFIDLDVIDDVIEKCTAIINNENYDTKIKINLELSESELFQLFCIAHERDITLNQLVEEILRNEIRRLQNDKS